MPPSLPCYRAPCPLTPCLCLPPSLPLSPSLPPSLPLFISLPPPLPHPPTPPPSLSLSLTAWLAHACLQVRLQRPLCVGGRAHAPAGRGAHRVPARRREPAGSQGARAGGRVPWHGIAAVEGPHQREGPSSALIRNHRAGHSSYCYCYWCCYSYSCCYCHCRCHCRCHCHCHCHCHCYCWKW